jgi:glycosyltransferase involved in cell wall biosynthesis
LGGVREKREPLISNNQYTILHTEWSSGWGGQEQRIILESRKMMELGHRVIIACQPGSGILAKALESGIPTEEVIIRGNYDLRAVFDLYRLIRKEGITVVNTHSGKDSWVGGFAAKLGGTPLLIRTRHLSVPVSTNPLNIVYRLPDGIITTGVAIRDVMIATNHIPPEKIVSIATGVSLGRFDKEHIDGKVLKQRLGLPEDCLVVTMVAVLRSMKRHDLLISAAGLLKDRFPTAKYLLVGDGPGREGIEKLIDEQGLSDRIILTGYRNDIPEILALSDMVVLTSDRFEGVPQSLSQAMAMALPVVASPVGGIGELIMDGETGLLAETGSAEAYADAIATLLGDDGLRKKLGEAARKHIVDNYTDDAMIKSTLSFYEKLLERKRIKRGDGH